MRSQVSRTVSHCFGILRQLRSIRRSLSHEVFHCLIAALVLTKLDFGNATLAGIPSFQLHLQARSRMLRLDWLLAHSMSLCNREASVVRLSVCLSVCKLCANRYFYHRSGWIATKLAHDGPQMGPHPGCAQGQGQGQRSRDTDTFLPTLKSLLLPQT